MHYGFNLKLDRRDLPVTPGVVTGHTTSIQQKVIDLKKFLMRDAVSLDADLIATHLFPDFSCDVFISHSFADREIAIQLAYELKQKGVVAFIDSVVWESSYDLLKTIDDTYSKNPGAASYSYERCTRSAAHVYMILATALQKMIMKSSTLLFLNTENSVSIKNSLQGNDKTHSPWIHMELMFSRSIWQLEGGDGVMLDNVNKSAASVMHSAPTDHLKPMTSSTFVQWLRAQPARTSNTSFTKAIELLHRGAL